MRAIALALGFVVAILCLFEGCGATRPPSVARAPSAQSAHCPPEMALVDAFCIDRWEASAVEITPAGEVPYPYYQPITGKRVRAMSKPDVMPQGYVSYIDASAACAEAGKRLCREAEWVRACKGGARTTFPYGSVRRTRVCNDSGKDVMTRLPLNQRAMNMVNMNSPALLQLPDTVAKTGSFADCTNDFGVYDMVGNLHEWIADGVRDRPWRHHTTEAFAGGFFLDTTINGQGCDYKTVAHAASYHDYSIGFRCCAEPL